MSALQRLIDKARDTCRFVGGEFIASLEPREIDAAAAEFAELQKSSASLVDHHKEHHDGEAAQSEALAAAREALKPLAAKWERLNMMSMPDAVHVPVGWLRDAAAALAKLAAVRKE